MGLIIGKVWIYSSGQYTVLFKIHIFSLENFLNKERKERLYVEKGIFVSYRV